MLIHVGLPLNIKKLIYTEEIIYKNYKKIQINTYGFEGSGLLATTIGRHVIDGNASTDRVLVTIKATEVSLLRYQLIGTVFRGSEVQTSRPYQYRY
jgi:hypothetical protein